MISKSTLRVAMNIFIEFGPLFVFFFTFEFFRFMTAVMILVVTVIISLVASMIINKHVSWFPIISSGSVIVFGTMTLVTHNPNYIIFKDTLYFGGFGGAIIFQLCKGELLLKEMFSNIFAVSDRGWKFASWLWGLFMVALAVSNEFARVYFSADQWVHYKFIVLFGIVVFGVCNVFISRFERLPSASRWGFQR